MAVRRVGVPRNQLDDLLVRPPWNGSTRHCWTSLVVDPIEQIEELADLRDRGLLSTEEFEEQKRKVLGP